MEDIRDSSLLHLSQDAVAGTKVNRLIRDGLGAAAAPDGLIVDLDAG